ncbi:geranylgeranylglyceryl/heptaprenylglyceryl phosphate synthase [Flavobacterium sp.]|uniref:geranylgeranylglyceryl/heptaprenylglyceryl phosphate synthase n=1 Tax=Flavobacterium sp. TaxID=239 RepID=UPI002FD9BCE0
MKKIYDEILLAKAQNRRLVAILLDPDKVEMNYLSDLIEKIKTSPATHVLVGGSLVESDKIDELVLLLKAKLLLPIILFPGDPSQISLHADGILFLSLLSGRNPDYLIEHHVNAVPLLKESNLEVISTGYLLIESGSQTAVERVSQTQPLDRKNIQLVCQTAKAGEYLGNKLIYLEAGSGAQLAVPLEMVNAVSNEISIPLIVGGGIRSQQAIQAAFESGADMVVIGTAFENDSNFFKYD